MNRRTSDLDEEERRARSEGGDEPDALYDPWQEFDAPIFPVETLPPSVRNFVEAKTVETGACISAIAMSALAAASGALTHAAKLYLKPGKNFAVSPRLWVVLVAPPSGRKTPAQEGAVRPLGKFQHARHAEWKRKKQTAEQDKTEFSEPEPKQLIAYDTTPEKMADILSRQDGGILVHHDELSGFVGSMDRYATGKGASSDRAFWLKAYDGGPYNVQRVGRPTVPISNLSVSILGGIQPSRLRELKGLSSDGLLQRFLPVMMRKPKMDSDYFDAAAREEWEAFLAGLLEYGAFTTELSVNARKIMTGTRQKLFIGSQIESEGEAFQGFVGKLDGVWGSLCLLLHVMWGGRAADQISETTASMATRLIEEFILPHGLAFYRSVAGATQDEHKAIGAFLIDFKASTVKVRDFSRGPRCFRGLASDEIAKKIGPFIAGGWITPEIEGPGNSAWKINPVVRAYFKRAADQHREWIKDLQTKISGKDQ